MQAIHADVSGMEFMRDLRDISRVSDTRIPVRIEHSERAPPTSSFDRVQILGQR